MFSQVSVVISELPLCGFLLPGSLRGPLHGEEGALLCQGSLEEETADNCSPANVCEVMSSHPCVFKSALRAVKYSRCDPLLRHGLHGLLHGEDGSLLLG